MPGREAVPVRALRVVPRVERGEAVNAGVVLFCRPLRFLGAPHAARRGRCWPRSRPDCDAGEVRAHLDAIERIAAGAADGGPIAALASPSASTGWSRRRARSSSPAGPHRPHERSGGGARAPVRASRQPLSARQTCLPQVPGFRSVEAPEGGGRRKQGTRQARRRRPAGASAAPVILAEVRRTRLLIAAAAILGLGCGGSGDRATARSATPSPTATATSTPTATIARPGLRLQQIGSFASPVYVTAPPGDRRRIFVVEQGGTRADRARRQDASSARSSTSADRITSGGEHGLLSLAFAPDYASSGRFYVYYTDAQRRHPDRRVPARASAERADHDSARVVLSVSHPASNHNGGLLLFGPGQAALRRPRRRRRRRRPARQPRQRPEPRARCSARSCASTRAAPAAAPTACRPATRS